MGKIKKIVVFGGTGGIGSNIVPLLKKEYDVISLGSNDFNVLDLQSVGDFFSQNDDIDIVLNLTGFSYDGFIHKYNSNDSYLNMIKQIDVNIKGTMNIIISCLPSMRKNGYGRIILLSSVLSEMPVMGAGVYSACKSYIDAITRSVSLENSSVGITCNSIQLGYFDAGILYNIPEKIRDGILGKIPTKRWGSIDELYRLIELLINVEYITGTNQKINGGIYY